MTSRFCSGFLLGCTLLSLAAPASAASSAPAQRTVGTSAVNSTQQTCVRTAAYNRETAILASLNNFYTRMEKTLQARRALINGAWTVTDAAKRRDTLKSIWKQFGMTWKQEDDSMQNAVRDAWLAYRTARSDCHVNGYDEESGGFGADSQF